MNLPPGGRALSLANGNGTPFPTSQSNQYFISKKRKAHDPADDDKENLDTPATPRSKQVAEEDQRERTPGRDGPIKEEQRGLEPDIKPFKGPPGKKVRKTPYEKNEEYRQFCRENEGHPFHELYVCFDKGPHGSPTYDKSGFQLDYDKVAEWMKPKAYNKKRILRNMDNHLAKAAEDDKRMAEIFFEKGEAPKDYRGVNFWKDRVSKDLGVPWHKITVGHFEEWEKKGFRKARKGEYENFTEEEKKRELRLISGASLRK